MKHAAMSGRRPAGPARTVALLALLAGSAAIARAAAPAAFVLALDGPVAASHAPYLHAAASGAWTSAGLSVSIAYPMGRGAALAMLTTGRADACVADAVAILAARASGAKITIVASIGDLHPACVVSREEAAIGTPASLAGKRVAVDPLDADRLLFSLFLAGAGLRPEDVTLVPLDGAGRQAALAAGTVDAALDRIGGALSGNAPSGTVILPWAEHGFTPYGPCLAVRDGVLRERPSTVRAFLKAILQTWEACLRDPPAAAQSAAVSGLVTREATEGWLESVRPLFDTETFRTKGLGWIDRFRMAATLEAVRGMIGQPVTFAAADAFNTALLPVPAVLRKVDEASEPGTGATSLQR